MEGVYRAIPLCELDRKTGVYPVTRGLSGIVPFCLCVEAIPVDFCFRLGSWRRDDDVIKVVFSISDRVEVVRQYCWPDRSRLVLRTCKYKRMEKKIRNALDKLL